MPIAPAARTRLEKAAGGFDLALGTDGDWLAYGSSHAPLRVFLTANGDSLVVAAFSQANVVAALADQGVPITDPVPAGACGARSVTSFPALHRLLRRAFQLSRTLPDELLVVFQKATADMPRSTEAERLVVQRVGQDIYRGGLLEYWEGCQRNGRPDLLCQWVGGALHRLRGTARWDFPGEE